MKVGKKEALVTLNGSVVIVPQMAVEEGSTFKTIDNSFTPVKGVVLEGGKSSFLEAKDATILAAIFSLFALMFFVEGTRYAKDDSAEQEKIQALLEEHPSLASSYTRDSIGSKYRAIDTKERKKREVINSLSRMIFKGVSLTTFSVDDKRFQAQFDCKDAKVAKKLQDLAKQQKFNTTRIANSNALKIGGIL